MGIPMVLMSHLVMAIIKSDDGNAVLFIFNLLNFLFIDSNCSLSCLSRVT